MELTSEVGNNDRAVKFYLGENKMSGPQADQVDSNPNMDFYSQKGSRNEKASKCSYRRFLTVDDDIEEVFKDLPQDDSADKEDKSENMKNHVKRHSSFGSYIRKKLLSPIVERKKGKCRGIQSSVVNSEKGHIEDLMIDKDNPSVDEDDSTVGSDVLDKSEAPNIGLMMKSLFLKSETNEKEFKAIDPLDMERRISCDPKNVFSERGKKVRASSGPIGKIKQKVFKSSSSGHIGQRNSYNCEASASTGDVPGTSIKLLGDRDDQFKIYLFDNDGIDEKMEHRARRSAEDFRRNSSPEIFPRPSTKPNFVSLFDIFREKKNGRNNENRSLSKPELRKRCDSDSKKLHRERSEPYIASFSSNSSKLRKGSSCSSFASKRGTPVLSRESSIASPFTSKRGTPVLSRESSFASSFASKRGTPILSRDSSFASKGTPKSSHGSNSNSPYGSKRGTPKLSRDSSLASPLPERARCSVSPCTSRRSSRLNQESKISLTFVGSSKGQSSVSEDQGVVPKTKKMSKVNSQPQLEVKNRMPTPKLRRRKSTPKLKRHRETENEKAKLAQSDVNFKMKKEVDHVHVFDSKPNVKRRTASQSAEIGNQTKVFRPRSLSEQKGLQKMQAKTKLEKPATSRKSRLDYFQLSVDDKIEKWLENVSAVGFFHVFLAYLF